MKTRLARTVGALAVVLFPLLARAQFSITPIVTTSTPVPGGVGTFREFSARQGTGLVAPSIDGSSVAFAGIDSNLRGGLYRWDNGVISMVANWNTPIPGGGENFNSIGYGTISGSQVAFKGGGVNVDGGYLAEGGQIQHIIGSPYDGIGEISITDRQIAFQGETHVGTTLYQSVNRIRDPGGLEVVADSTTTVPGTSEHFQSFGDASIGKGGYIAFYGSGANQRGIYRADANNVISVVADKNTPVPGGGGNFLNFDNVYVSADGANVAFSGSSATKVGIFEQIDGVLKAVAIGGQAAPGGGTFTFGSYNPIVSLDGGHIAFFASTGPRYSIFTDYRNKLERVIGTTDILNGKIVQDIKLTEDSLSGSSLAFSVIFNDNSTAVYLAKVPEPSSIALLLPVLLMIRRGKRCHRLGAD